MSTPLERLTWAMLGIAGFAGLFAVCAIACVYGGLVPVAADNKPLPLEATLGMQAMHATSAREMGGVPNPLPVTDANLAAGLRLYRRECMICHGASDGRPSDLARGLYVPSPQFAIDGAEDDPEGATFWKIRHGIRFTAMPAFGSTLSETEAWQVTMFVKRMDRLPAGVARNWTSTGASKHGMPDAGARRSMTMP